MGPTIVAVLLAAVIGLLVGSSSQRAKRARLDYVRTRQLIPAARKLAIAESLRGLRFIVIAVLVLVALGAAMHVVGRQ